MKPLVIVPMGRALPALDALATARAGDRFEVRREPLLPTPAALDAERPTVVLLDRTLFQSAGEDAAAVSRLAEQAAVVAVGEPGATEPDEALPAEALSGFFAADRADAPARVTLQGALRHAAALVAAHRASRLEERSTADLQEMTRIGVALSTERDLMTLLDTILVQARRLSSADAGSLYLVRHQGGGAPDVLQFKLAQNFTLPNLPFRETEMALDHTSLAGYAAATNEPLVIPDVYLLPEDVSYKQNRSFDESVGYRTKSMLVIPMRTHRDEVIGVLQLINRKRDPAARLTSPAVVDAEVLPFDQRAVDLVNALASQAAVAIENSRLYEDIERLFEGFVMASVTAIESRDPTTSGHSARVATFTCGLAEAIDRGGSGGAYRGLRFSREQMREIRYASLLHDFGKVGVREQVLVKQKKLYPSDLAIIKHRFQFLLQRADLQYERERAEFLYAHGTDRYTEALGQLDQARRGEREQLQRFLDSIVRANEPTILPEGTFEELEEINARTFVDFDGVEKPLLSDEELRYLMINKGNLDSRERREIESHVTHTFRFLEHIPWTSELRGIPTIAYGHHEKLNGQGYPRQVTADAIPVQTRMMTISDIYDALTATDRPYKRAVPAERAIEILEDEAAHGAIDKSLLATFVEARVFELVKRQPTPTAGLRLS
ncbi:MAG: GAF domain-containing protein [Gemmatimonadetes bacterium]|nr:GAF domain-containing protein [Gemmatimonadota bacterium]